MTVNDEPSGSERSEEPLPEAGNDTVHATPRAPSAPTSVGPVRRHLQHLPLPIALTAAAWLSVGQAEVLLRQYQQAGTQSYGVRALGGGWRPRPTPRRRCRKPC